MSILIGLHIARALKREKNITDKVGDRIFPLIVPQGVDKYPFIAYDMTGGSGASTKDGNVEDTASVQVSVVAKSHGEALKIGNYVRYALDGYTPTYEEFKVCSTGNIVYNDEYIEALDAYSVNISIDFRTIDF